MKETIKEWFPFIWGALIGEAVVWVLLRLVMKIPVI